MILGFILGLLVGLAVGAIVGKSGFASFLVYLKTLEAKAQANRAAKAANKPAPLDGRSAI